MRIYILTDKGAGRHTLTRNYFKGRFEADYMSTVGVQIESKDIEVNQKKIRLVIHFLEMREYFSGVHRTYCHGADSAIILYDIGDSKILERIHEWIRMLRESAGDIPIILVGNKADLKNREVSKEEAMKIKDKFSLSGFFEISAKTGANVEKMFREVVQLTLNNRGIIP